MDIKNTIIGAEVVIESLITLLKNEDVDISSIQFSVGDKEKGIESENMSFESLVNLALKGLGEAKAQAVADLGELQERIAGHQYYHDERGHMVVDMDDVVKEISGFDSWKAQAVPEGFVLVKKVHPDAIVHNQGLGLFKECQVIYGWGGKSKDFKDALNKGFYHGVKLGAKAVLETTMIEAQEPVND